MNDNTNEYIALWESVTQKCQEYLNKVTFSYDEMQALYSTIVPARVEYSLGSRYLPRGFYCPSPDITCFITNMKRGRIAKRITSASRPTNRYLFNSSNELYLADTFFPNGAQRTEYIFREQGATYGVTWGERLGKVEIRQLNIEEYSDGKLACYMWAVPILGSSGHYITSVLFETFIYHSNDCIETNFYIIEAPEIGTKKHYDVFITHYKTGFTLDSSNMILLQSAVELGYAKKHFLHST